MPTAVLLNREQSVALFFHFAIHTIRDLLFLFQPAILPAVCPHIPNQQEITPPLYKQKYSIQVLNHGNEQVKTVSNHPTPKKTKKQDQNKKTRKNTQHSKLLTKPSHNIKSVRRLLELGPEGTMHTVPREATGC